MKKIVEILNKAIVETLKVKGITSKEANEVIELIAEARDKALNLPFVMQAEGEPLPEYELAYCPYCLQMTNHLNNVCQKHSGNGA